MPAGCLGNLDHSNVPWAFRAYLSYHYSDTCAMFADILNGLDIIGY